MIADDIFAGPHQLPLLEVDDNVSFFSSNAAAQYLFPVLDLSEDGQWYVLFVCFFINVVLFSFS